MAIPCIRFSCFRKISLSLLWPQGLYLRLNLSNRWKVLLSAWTSSRSTFRSYLFGKKNYQWNKKAKSRSQKATSQVKRVELRGEQFFKAQNLGASHTQINPSSQKLLSMSNRYHHEIWQPEEKVYLCKILRKMALSWWICEKFYRFYSIKTFVSDTFNPEEEKYIWCFENGRQLK